jgi:hypothetical protein
MAQRRQFYNQEGFVYNPADDIRRNLAIGAQGLDNAFKKSDEQAEWDFKQVKDTHDNLEVIAASFNEYHSDLLNKELQGVEQGVSAAILKNGKLDYAQMGEVNRAVTRLKTMQNNSQNAVKSYKNAVEMMQTNIGNMRDPVGTQLKMKALLEAPETLSSPRDLGKQINELYQEGVDWQGLVNKRINSTLDGKKKTSKSFTYTDDESGDLVTVEALIIEGVTEWDDVQKKVVEVKTTNDFGIETGALTGLKSIIMEGDEALGYEKYVVGSSKAKGNTVEGEIGNTINQYISSTSKVTSRLTPAQQRLQALNLQDAENKVKMSDFQVETQKDVYDLNTRKVESGITTEEQNSKNQTRQLDISQQNANTNSRTQQANALEKGLVIGSDGNYMVDPNNPVTEGGVRVNDNGSLSFAEGKNYIDFSSGLKKTRNILNFKKVDGKYIGTDDQNVEHVIPDGVFRGIANSAPKEDRKALMALKNTVEAKPPADTEVEETGDSNKKPNPMRP